MERAILEAIQFGGYSLFREEFQAGQSCLINLRAREWSRKHDNDSSDVSLEIFNITHGLGQIMGDSKIELTTIQCFL